MTTATQPLENKNYSPALAAFAVLGSVWVFVLVTLGAFTTTINAGMAFADWPLSNGSVSPNGWLTNISMFAEHAHRLSATTMGIITIALSLWILKTVQKPWLRKLGLIAIGMVILQGILGGLRVLLDGVSFPGFEMTVGQMLRIPHGIVAQAYVCILIAIATGCSKAWSSKLFTVSHSVKKLGRWCVGLLFLQLTIAAVMRHNNAGLAIPSFPFSNSDRTFIPHFWSFKVGIHFAHRIMAVILTIMLSLFVIKVWRDKGSTLGMRFGASALLCLLGLQLLLGMSIIWSLRAVAITTGHVVIGALTLATCFWLTFYSHRDHIEKHISL
jgi:cytochrome c oxidase assembly protein subunit 15